MHKKIQFSHSSKIFSENEKLIDAELKNMQIFSNVEKKNLVLNLSNAFVK